MASMGLLLLNVFFLIKAVIFLLFYKSYYFFIFAGHYECYDTGTLGYIMYFSRECCVLCSDRQLTY